MQKCKIYAFFRIVINVSDTENGDCGLTKRTTIYAENTIDTIDIRRHKAKRNSYKYNLQTPPNTRPIWDSNTDSVPSSLYHNLWLKTINKYIYILFNFNTVQIKWYVIIYQF
jgi:hypothetical protein